jgi:hypothetical protein
MKILKAIITIIAAMAAWILTVLLFGLIDEAVNYWITDHEFTQVMSQGIIYGVATIVLLKMRANTIVAIAFNIAILVMVYFISDIGMNQMMGVWMMAYLLPVYLKEKGGAGNERREAG